MNKRILTGITTTGTPHIGNYLGAIKPALNLSKEYDESFFFLADYHAIIKNTYSEDISKSVESVALAWLSSGLDAEKSYFYRRRKDFRICTFPFFGWLKKIQSENRRK